MRAHFSLLSFTHIQTLVKQTAKGYIRNTDLSIKLLYRISVLQNESSSHVLGMHDKGHFCGKLLNSKWHQSIHTSPFPHLLQLVRHEKLMLPHLDNGKKMRKLAHLTKTTYNTALWAFTTPTLKAIYVTDAYELSAQIQSPSFTLSFFSITDTASCCADRRPLFRVRKLLQYFTTQWLTRVPNHVTPPAAAVLRCL